MSSQEYSRLYALPDEPWSCLHCALPKISDSYFDSTVSTNSDVISDISDSSISSMHQFDYTSVPVVDTSTKAIFGANINARSLKNKVSELQAVVQSMNLSVIAVTETWLDSTILDSALFETHSVFRRDRNRRGGGVLLAISNSLNPKALDCSDFPSTLEFVCAVLTINSERWLCGVYYRPPTDVASLGLLEDVLNNLHLDMYAGCILMGDLISTGRLPILAHLGLHCEN